MKLINKMIQKRQFNSAYNELLKINYSYSFKSVSQDFPEIDRDTMLLYLSYALSRSESVEKYISICNLLYFEEPYIEGTDSFIKWILNRALIVFPNNKIIIDWIISVFSGNPDCPFSESEMNSFLRIN
ncbi:MAG: hypothetical protein IJS45_08735 [Clostridia bacterium]|nr:hypothetical protein [Clostridia bacterium]